MVRIEYSEKGVAVSDFDIEKAVDLVEQDASFDNPLTLAYSTDNVIHGIRARIAKHKIDHKKIVFLFQGQELHPDKTGRIEHWPDCFCDHMNNHLMDILGYKESNSWSEQLRKLEDSEYWK